MNGEGVRACVCVKGSMGKGLEQSEATGRSLKEVLIRVFFFLQQNKDVNPPKMSDTDQQTPPPAPRTGPLVSGALLHPKKCSIEPL